MPHRTPVKISEPIKGWLLIVSIAVASGFIGANWKENQVRREYAETYTKHVEIVAGALDGISNRLLNMLTQGRPPSDHQLKLTKTEVEKAKAKLKEPVK